MDLFAFGYFAVICGALAVSTPLLETGFRRLLLGLTTGVISAVALPFIRDMLMGSV